MAGCLQCLGEAGLDEGTAEGLGPAAEGLTSRWSDTVSVHLIIMPHRLSSINQHQVGFRLWLASRINEQNPQRSFCLDASSGLQLSAGASIYVSGFLLWVNF